MAVELLVQRYFGYVPSHAGVVAGLAIFATLAAASTALTLYTRAHRFMLVVALTAALEAAGYVSRLVATTNPSTASVASMQVLFVGPLRFVGCFGRWRRRRRAFFTLSNRARLRPPSRRHALSHQTHAHTQKKPSKTRQFLLIVTPTLLAVVAYIVLGRLLALSPRADASVGRLKPRHIARLFGIRFCLCFFA